MSIASSIQIINGPNLNLVGKREEEIYGTQSFEVYFEKLKKNFQNLCLFYYQSNVEGELINRLHELSQDSSSQMIGIVLNAGAYTHTSVALGDAIKAIKIPVVEVHMSNIFERESFRHVSHISASCIGSIGGFRMYSYHLAIQALLARESKMDI